MAKFKEGDRVLLHADPEEFLPDQCPSDEVGTVLDYEGNDTYLVEVDTALEFGDDRLREVTEDQMHPSLSLRVINRDRQFDPDAI